MARRVHNQSAADGVACARCASTSGRDRHANRSCRIHNREHLLDCARLRDRLRHHPVERGIGGVERAGELGGIEDIGDAPSLQLELEFGDDWGAGHGL